MRGESAITLSIWIRSRYRLVIPSSHIHAQWFWSLLLLPRSSGSWDIDSLSSRFQQILVSGEKVSGENGITLSIWQLASVSLLIQLPHGPRHWFWSSILCARVLGSWDIDTSSSRIPANSGGKWFPGTLKCQSFLFPEISWKVMIWWHRTFRVWVLCSSPVWRGSFASFCMLYF